MATPKSEYFERTFKWSIASISDKDGGIPVVHGCSIVPECLVSVTDRKKVKWHSGFIHFFKDDYTFDGAGGAWFETKKFIGEIKGFRGVLSPDYSLYSDFDLIPQMWNVYRSRLVAVELEQAGINVIPTVSWSTEASFEFCFNGLPHESILAVSTVGVKDCIHGREMFQRGYGEMCRRLNPRIVLVYGSTRGFDMLGRNFKCYPNSTYHWTLTATEEKESK